MWKGGKKKKKRLLKVPVRARIAVGGGQPPDETDRARGVPTYSLHQAVTVDQRGVFNPLAMGGLFRPGDVLTTCIRWGEGSLREQKKKRTQVLTSFRHYTRTGHRITPGSEKDLFNKIHGFGGAERKTSDLLQGTQDTKQDSAPKQTYLQESSSQKL